MPHMCGDGAAGLPGQYGIAVSRQVPAHDFVAESGSASYCPQTR